LFRNFCKNEGQIKLVTSAILEGRLSHAYIIEGDAGSGKLTFARLTCTLLAGGRSNTNALKILEGISPDVTEYDVPEKKKFITVDTIRQIKYDAYIKPNELDVRVFIINHAEAINTQGQNALLKLLEEPPKNVYFFLLCENSTALLPTVRSRAQCIRMERLSENTVKEYLINLGYKDDERLKSAVALSSGTIGRALEVLAEQNEKSSQSLEPFVISLFDALKSSDFQNVIIQTSKIPQERGEAEKYLIACQTAVRDMVASSCKFESTLFFPSFEEAQKTAGYIGIKNLLALDECLGDAIRDLNLNMNVQTLKICLAKRMMSAVCQ
jgi:DNA polymerase III gamma/tau subunit